jgi:hypothetical protein
MLSVHGRACNKNDLGLANTGTVRAVDVEKFVDGQLRLHDEKQSRSERDVRRAGVGLAI